MGVVGALCTFAVAATPALAHEFTASKTSTTTGKAESKQELKFGPFKITCFKVRDKGAQAEGSSTTLTVAVRFNLCSDEVKFGIHPAFVPTRFLTPLAVTYHANGYVETGSEIEEFEGSAELAGGTAEIKVNTGVIQGTTEKSQCTIHWPAQTLPLKAIKKPAGEYSIATYSNTTAPKPVSKAFPDGLQHSIEISNEFEGIKYEFEGEPCEEWGKKETAEGGAGTYLGSFPVLLVGGNLEFS